jgi:hypothetical protein
MTCRMFVGAWVLASLLWTPGLTMAQAVNDDAAKWHVVIERMEPAALVSVRLKDGTRLKGTILSAEAESFTLKPRTRIPVAGRDIRYDALASLERTTVGMSPAKKVLIGVATGVGASVVLVAILVASAWD